MIPKETEADILRLFHAEKWPIGTIAGQLGVHHTTVQRVLQQTGVEIQAVAPRPSMADPFLPYIVEQLEKYSGLRASRLFQMVKARGYPGAPTTFGETMAAIVTIVPELILAMLVQRHIVRGLTYGAVKE